MSNKNAWCFILFNGWTFTPFMDSTYPIEITGVNQPRKASGMSHQADSVIRWPSG